MTTRTAHTPLEGYWAYTKTGMVPNVNTDGEHAFDWVHATDFFRVQKMNNELLEALKELREQAIDTMKFSNQYDGQLIQAIHNAEQAISKAEGR